MQSVKYDFHLPCPYFGENGQQLAITARQQLAITARQQLAITGNNRLLPLSWQQ